MISPHYYNTIYSNLQLLPETVQKQAFDYINYLVLKYYTESATVNLVNTNETKFREFGVFKGKISVPDDFNEPMDDFNEY